MKKFVSKHWNIPKLLTVLDNSIVDKIIAILIHVSNFRDEFIRGPASNGMFSIKSVTWLHRGEE